MYQVTITNDNVTTVISSGNNSSNKILSGVIKRELNAIDSFTFSISLNNKAWSQIKPFKTIVSVKNLKTGEFEFIGRPLDPEKEMDSGGLFHKTFVCEGELAYLHDTVQRHGEYHNITPSKFLETILNAHNKQVSDDKKIYLGKCTVTNSTDNVYRYLTYDSSWESIQQKLVERLGGYLFIRYENGKRYLDYLAESGTTQKMSIKLAQNMKSIKQDLKVSEVVTRLIPLGQTIESEDEQATDASQARLDIKAVNGGKDYLDDTKLIAEFGIIEGIQTWEDVTVASTLKTKGQQWLNSQRITQSIDISALNLHYINEKYSDYKIGNYYQTVNQVASIEESYQLISQEIDLFNIAESSLTFGDLKLTLSKYQSQTNKEKQRIQQLTNTVNAQVSRIANANKQIEETNGKLIELQETVSNGGTQIESQIQEIIELINNIQIPDLSGLVELAEFNDYVAGQELVNQNQVVVNETQNKINQAQSVINADFEARLQILEGIG